MPATTPDQNVADRIGETVDLYIQRLADERAQLAQAASRITEIDAELALFRAEKARLDPRRPPVAQGPNKPVG